VVIGFRYQPTNADDADDNYEGKPFTDTSASLLVPSCLLRWFSRFR
jgi:rubredoxin